MPYFYFDLVVGEEFKDQGSMILEDTDIAFEKADSLASELYIVRPELRSRGCSVRLTRGEISTSVWRLQRFSWRGSLERPASGSIVAVHPERGCSKDDRGVGWRRLKRRYRDIVSTADTF